MYIIPPSPTHPTIPDYIAPTTYLLKNVNHEHDHYVIISIFPSLPHIYIQILSSKNFLHSKNKSSFTQSTRTSLIRQISV